MSSKEKGFCTKHPLCVTIDSSSTDKVLEWRIFIWCTLHIQTWLSLQKRQPMSTTMDPLFNLKNLRLIALDGYSSHTDFYLPHILPVKDYSHTNNDLWGFLFLSYSSIKMLVFDTMPINCIPKAIWKHKLNTQMNQEWSSTSFDANNKSQHTERCIKSVLWIYVCPLDNQQTICNISTEALQSINHWKVLYLYLYRSVTIQVQYFFKKE